MSLSRVGRIDSIRSRDVNGTRRRAEKRPVGNRSAVPGSSAKRENRPNYEKRKVRKPGPDPGWDWEAETKKRRSTKEQIYVESKRRTRKHDGLPARAPNQDRTENRGDRAPTTLDSTIMHFTDSNLAPSLRLSSPDYQLFFNRTSRDTRSMRRERDRRQSFSLI